LILLLLLGSITNVQILLKPDRVGTLMNQSTVSHQKLVYPPIRAFKRTQLVRNTIQHSHHQYYDQSGQGTAMPIDAIHIQTSSIWTYLGDCKEVITINNDLHRYKHGNNTVTW
jgi:hypothetical protein